MKEIVVREYFESGKSDSQNIARCLSLCSRGESCTLVFSGGEFLLDEAILLSENMTVILDNCVLRQRDCVFDNIFRGENCIADSQNPYGVPLSVTPIRNLKIIGLNGATIMGPEKHRKMYHPFFQEEQEMVGDYWGWRAHLISFSQCSNFEISGLTVQRTNSWAFCFDFCSGGFIHDIEFHTDVKNGDGIDFRAGCHHCHVKNITGTTMDDTIACTALYSPVRAPQYLFPSEPSKHLFCQDFTQMAIHDILIEDLQVSGKYHQVICLAGAGIQVHDITVRNLKEGGGVCRQTSLVDIYAAGNGNAYGNGYQPGDLHDIVVEDVVSAQCPPADDAADGAIPAVVSCRAQVRNVKMLHVVSHNSEIPAVIAEYPQGVTVIPPEA